MRVIPLLLGLLLSGAVSAAEAPGLDPRERLTLDPAVLRGELDNGLEYFIRVNHRPEKRAELRLVVDAGSVLEDEDQRGLAHFVEHMGFNGTKHFRKQKLVDYLERIGMRFGADLNAYTSFDQTVYQLTVPTDDRDALKKGFLILSDWAQHMSFEDEEIEAERGVVLEEMRLGRGAERRIWERHFPVLFQGSRYAERLTIGTEEVLTEAPPATLRRYYRDWYRPDLMAVVAVGDFDPGKIEKLIRKRFGKLKNPDEPRKRTVFSVPDHDETLVSVAVDPEATGTTLSVYYKLDKRPTGTVGDYRRGLIEGLYHSMIRARLDELRQQPNPPFLWAGSSSGSFVRSRDLYYQTVRVEEGGLERGLETLLTEVKRVDRFGFTATELERAKKRRLRSLEQAWRERDKQRSSSLSRQLESHFLTGSPLPGLDRALALTKEILPGVELDEVNRLARKWITDRNRVILVSAPEKDETEPPAKDALIRLFETVERAELEPWVDRVRDEPLVPEPPSGGEVVERKEIAELGVTEWRLANGVRVVLKPTDFKNDEILLSGFSPGGHSLVADDAYISAAYAGSLVSAGGLGSFDRIELDKALAGKVARVWAGIGELEESISGSASPEDVETMFQLVYLQFTAPRKDPEATAAWRERQRAFLENRLARPETVFGDKYREVLYGEHLRRQPPSIEKLDRIDLDRALAVYRDRFADASDFTFVIVGNFDEDELEPWVTTYLGGLPSTKRKERFKDLGIRPRRDADFEVRRGLEDKSQVRITFTRDAEWTREESYVVGSLAQVLRTRLREILREDMGATYGVGVWGSIRRRPVESFSFTVSFGCAPENVEEMTAAVFDELRRFREEGIERSYVQKVKESQLRKRETDLKENSFWRYGLLSHYRYETDPQELLDYPTLVGSLTADKLVAAAKRYLAGDDYVYGVLYPEAHEEEASED